MYDITKIPIGRIEIAVGLIMNEAIARGHAENGSFYTPSSRLMSLLMDINEEVTRGVNERMNLILKEEGKRAKHYREQLASTTSATAMLALSA